MNLEPLKKVLEGKTRFLLIAHEQPDGDALGAILSFGQFLSDLGKTVKLASKDVVPELFEFLNGSDRIANDFLLGDFDVIVLIDNGDLKRTGFANRLVAARKQGKTIINIDHHLPNDLWKMATINISDPAYSSTSEIIYDIFKWFNYHITPAVATSLLTGIFYDTGGFLHSNTTDKVMNKSSELLKLGANLRKVSQGINQSKSVSMLKLWGVALGRLKVLKSGLAYSILTQEDLIRSGASEENISGLVGMINTTAEAAASLLIYETSDGKIKGSLRTENDRIDVSRLAKALGGGGHKKASGFAVSGRIVRDGKRWSVE